MDHRKPHGEHGIFERVPETDTALEKYREAMDIQKTSQCESNETIRSCKRKPAAGAGDLGNTGKKIEKLPSQASANDGFSATGSLGALRGVWAPGVDDTVANRSLRPARQLRPKQHQQMFRRRRLQKPKEYRFRHPQPSDKIIWFPPASILSEPFSA